MAETNYSPDPRPKPLQWHPSRQFGAGAHGYSGGADLIVQPPFIPVPDEEEEEGDPIQEGLLTGLIGYYQLENVASLIDSSAFGMDFTVQGGSSISSVAGKVGNGMAVVTIDTTPAGADTHYEVSGDLTIGAWVQLDNNASDNGIFESGDAYGLGYFGSTGFMLLLTGGGGFGVQHTDVPANGAWTFVVGWWQRGVGLFISVNNGAPTFEPTADTTLIDGWLADRTKLGSWTETGVFTNGKLDEIGIWNRLLTQAELDWLWNGGLGQSVT